MGRKSRLKKEKTEHQIKEEDMIHPIKVETWAFLKKRNLEMEEASRFLYIVSILVNFFVYRTTKQRFQLPTVRPEEEENDENRLEAILGALQNECSKLGIVSHEVMDELVSPVAEDEALVEPILQKTYGMLESLIPSDSFRQAVENQIEDSESWGDSLIHYEDRKEDYFEATKKLFALDLAIVQSNHSGELEDVGYEQKLEEVRTTYGIEPDDFQKLSRRATEFLRVTFATYFEMDFQHVRDEVDAKIDWPSSDESQPAN